jgi:hypothetical protein
MASSYYDQCEQNDGAILMDEDELQACEDANRRWRAWQADQRRANGRAR